MVEKGTRRARLRVGSRSSTGNAAIDRCQPSDSMRSVGQADDTVFAPMPTISAFHGIVIRMYWRDHEPPHFHAIYAEFEASVDIRNGPVIGQSLADS
jgi:uncharacterized protein DUF4160